MDYFSASLNLCVTKEYDITGTPTLVAGLNFGFKILPSTSFIFRPLLAIENPMARKLSPSQVQKPRHILPKQLLQLKK
jgi:hypothetical protein